MSHTDGTDCTDVFCGCTMTEVRGNMKSWMKKNIVWVMFGGVIILFLLNFSMIFFVSGENTRGTFGDQFGAVNALFSGLAFTGLIYTIILQRRDLAMQRDDLRLQRDELALTRQEIGDKGPICKEVQSDRQDGRATS